MNCTVCSGELVATGTPKHSWWVCVDCRAEFPWGLNARSAYETGTAFDFKGFNLSRKKDEDE